MTAVTAPAESIWRDRAAAFIRKYAIVLIFLGMIALLAVLTGGKFLGIQNLINTVRQSAIYGILGLGVTVVIISGGIDLSVGSILGLAAVISASLAQQLTWKQAMYPGLDLPVIAPLIVALGVGAACGFVNGSLIAG